MLNWITSWLVFLLPYPIAKGAPGAFSLSSLWGEDFSPRSCFLSSMRADTGPAFAPFHQFCLFLLILTLTQSGCFSQINSLIRFLLTQGNMLLWQLLCDDEGERGEMQRAPGRQGLSMPSGCQQLLLQTGSTLRERKGRRAGQEGLQPAAQCFCTGHCEGYKQRRGTGQGAGGSCMMPDCSISIEKVSLPFSNQQQGFQPSPHRATQ